MNGVKLAALGLIVAGALALAYGGFSYTSETHQAKIGPLNLSVEETQTVNVPVWAGIGAMLIGGALLVFGSRKN
jgi:LPXTG-motif cell wall-anchored protein